MYASILGPDDHPNGYKTASVEAAGKVGKILGSRAAANGISSVAWSRPGKYHGKIKAFIDNVRASGIQTFQSYPQGTPPKPKTRN